MASEDREQALLALLAWEERLARWHGFPEASRKAFVETLAQLMTRIACEETEHERPRSDGEPAS